MKKIILLSGLLSFSISGLAAEAVKIKPKSDLISALFAANPFVQILLLLLIALSVISWGIILQKRKQINDVLEIQDKFYDRFKRSSSWSAVFERIGDFKAVGNVALFQEAYTELKRFQSHGGMGKSTDAVERSLRKATENELDDLEKKLGFLATTGSSAPFVGLLGTVIGIMSSFSQIANTGSASLAVVAPGISEALFSTAVGLFAALPAVAAYNYYIGKIRKIEIQLNGFSVDLINSVQISETQVSSGS